MQDRGIEVSSALKRQQIKIRTKLAYQEYFDTQGIDISGVSKQNLKCRVAAMRQGADFLQSCLVSGATPLSDEEQTYYRELGPHLDPREGVLLNYLETNLTIRHATTNLSDINRNGARLLPIRIRMANNENVVNSHTVVNTAEGGFVFFTLGVGEHKIAEFLMHNDPGIITIALPRFFEEEPDLAESLWVSPHYTDLMKSDYSHPVEFMGQRFSFYFNATEKTKTYCYERANGTHFTRTVKFKDEIYQGRQIPFAMALELALHLRFIGGAFRDYVLNWMVNESIPDHDKVSLLQKIMTILMPPDVATEAKIPNAIPLNLPCIRISSLPHLDNGCPLISVLLNSQLSDRERLRQLMEHMQNGAVPYRRQREFSINNNKEITALLIAAMCGYATVLKLFLSITVADEQYRWIRYVTTPNRIEFLRAIVSREPDSWAAQSRPDILAQMDAENFHMFTYLEQHGLKIAVFARSILFNITQSNKRLRNYILDNVPNLDLSPHLQTVLAIILIQTHDYERLKKCFENAVISVTASLKTGESMHVKEINMFETETTKLNFQMGYNLLHLAVLMGDEEAARIVMGCGVKQLLTDSGMTCLDLTEQLKDEVNAALNENWKKLREMGQSIQEYSKTRTSLYMRLTANKRIQQLLMRHGGVRNNNRTEHEKCTNVHTACVTVITGLNRHGHPVVVLGRKQIEPKNRYNHQPLVSLSGYVFPGGLKDISDEDFLAAAKREAKEETGLDIEQLELTGRANVELLHEFKKVSADGEVLHQIHFYHVYLGSHINGMRFYPHDDLKVVKVLPMAAIKKSGELPLAHQYTVDSGPEGAIPLLRSNGLLLDMLNGQEISRQIDDELALENDGYGMLCVAAGKGDLDTMRLCFAQGNVPIDLEDQPTTPMLEACKYGQMAAVLLLINQGPVANTYHMSSGNTPLTCAINGKHYAVIDELCRHGIILYGDLEAARQSKDPFIVKYVIVAFYNALVANYQANHNDNHVYGVFGKIKAALKCCVEYGDLVYAEKLVSHYYPELYDERAKLLALMLKRNYQALATQFLIIILQKQLSKQLATDVIVTITNEGRILYRQSDCETHIELSHREAAEKFTNIAAEITNDLIHSIQAVTKWNAAKPVSASAVGLYSHARVKKGDHRDGPIDDRDAGCRIM